MGTSFENLRVLQIAEGIADGIWRQDDLLLFNDDELEWLQTISTDL